MTDLEMLKLGVISAYGLIGFLLWLLLVFLTASGVTSLFRGGEGILAVIWPVTLVALVLVAVFSWLGGIVEGWGLRLHPRVQAWKEARRGAKEPLHRAKYLVVAGWVRSANDGEHHWVNPSQLMQLYQVNPRDCMTWEVDMADAGGSYFPKAEAFARRHNLTVLRPQDSGDYRLPLDEIAGVSISNSIKRGVK